MKTTVPVPRLNVPLFVKSLPTLSVAGALSVPVPLIVMLLKLVAVEPPMVDVPLNTTVPVPAVNVPALLVQMPATFILPAGAVSVPVKVRLLNELVLAPDIVVVPAKVTVPVPGVKVPSLTRFPTMLIVPDGRVNVFPVVIVTMLNAAVPATVVAPENVTVPVPAENNPPLIVQVDPFMNRLLVPAENVPPEKRAVPLIVILLVANVTVPLLFIVRLFKAVAVVGNSRPVEPVPV